MNNGIGKKIQTRDWNACDVANKTKIILILPKDAVCKLKVIQSLNPFM